MIIATQANPKSHAGQAKTSSGAAGWQAVVVLVCLALVELLCFGPIVRHCGFYLDDWTTLNVLHFGPQTFGERLLYYFFNDPRVIIRPVEVPFFASLYTAFGTSPLGYHLVNGILEILGSWFLYLSMSLYTGNRRLSFVSALMLLLYPIHDSTHYWILASSVTLSLTLYLASLWLCIKSVFENRLLYLCLSVSAFALSVFNYESFMPLCLLNTLCTLTLMHRRRSLGRACLGSLVVTAPYLLVVGAFWVYQRIIVPMLGNSLLHPVHFDPSVMFRTLAQGCQISMPVGAFPFFFQQLQPHLIQGLSLYDCFSVLSLCVLIAVTLLNLPRDEGCSVQAGKFVALGVITVVLSFTIFGLNAEYQPTLQTILNRINCGAAVGMAMIFAGTCGILARLLTIRTASAARTQVFVMSGLVSALAVFFLLTNGALSGPWNLSWLTQKNIIAIVKRNGYKLHTGDSLMLANCPRYVLWAPVFDGVWDFQAMVRLVLENQKINAGVVSERLVMAQDSMKDISAGFTCAVYPFKQLHVLLPATAEFYKVKSASDFINTIEHNGMQFGLEPQTIGRWREQITPGVKDQARAKNQ